MLHLVGLHDVLGHPPSPSRGVGHLCVGGDGGGSSDGGVGAGQDVCWHQGRRDTIVYVLPVKQVQEKVVVR